MNVLVSTIDDRPQFDTGEKGVIPIPPSRRLCHRLARGKKTNRKRYCSLTRQPSCATPLSWGCRTSPNIRFLEVEDGSRQHPDLSRQNLYLHLAEQIWAPGQLTIEAGE